MRLTSSTEHDSFEVAYGVLPTQQFLSFHRPAEFHGTVLATRVTIHLLKAI